MRIAVVIGNPKPGSRTLAAALAVADATRAALRISERLVLDLARTGAPR
jgi:NAD(P)H-dependent FMN reductase